MSSVAASSLLEPREQRARMELALDQSREVEVGRVAVERPGPAQDVGAEALDPLALVLRRLGSRRPPCCAAFASRAPRPRRRAASRQRRPRLRAAAADPPPGVAPGRCSMPRPNLSPSASSRDCAQHQRDEIERRLRKRPMDRLERRRAACRRRRLTAASFSSNWTSSGALSAASPEQGLGAAQIARGGGALGFDRGRVAAGHQLRDYSRICAPTARAPASTGSRCLR